MRLLFNSYMPDVAEEIVGGQGLITAQNVLKQPVGYTRAKSHTTIAWPSALNSRVMGSFLGRVSVPYGYKTYAGTTTKLWEINVYPTDWADRSLGGGTYTTTGPRWRFCQFGDYVVAVYGFTAGSSPAPQTINMNGGTVFADCETVASTCPAATFCMTVGQFLVLGNVKDRSGWGLGTRRDAVWWSVVGNHTSWLQPGTAAAVAAQTDYRQLYSGGRITALLGGEEAGLIFQDRNIWQMTYVGGSVMFEIVRIDSAHGCYVAGMVERIPTGILFVDRQGLYIFGPSGPEMVGANKFQKTFLDVVESAMTSSFENYMMMFSDPSNPYVYIKIRDHVFVYDWRHDEVTDLALLDSEVESLCVFRIAGSYDNPTLGTFNATHYLGRLATSMTGTLETGAVEPNPGGRATCVSARPLLGGTATLTLEVATKASDTDSWSAYGSAKSLNSWGAFDCSEDGRFFKFRLTFSAGTNPIIGLDVDFVPSGEA